MKLFYHKTDGGAEYLCSGCVLGTDEGNLLSRYIVRIDGDIRKDAELLVREGIAAEQPTPPDELLAQIAKRYLGIKTLEIQNSDSLDFHSLSVWNVKAALEAAWKAGKSAQ
jgi:hypothetical protein